MNIVYLKFMGTKITLEFCDVMRKKSNKIRHVGYYDQFGRIIHDSYREKTTPLEEDEERHILNATVASMLNTWSRADPLIGKVRYFVMSRDKILCLIIPAGENYFLVGLEADTPNETVDTIRLEFFRKLKL